MSKESPSHPNAGKEVRIEQYGNEVRLIFVLADRPMADKFCDDLVAQLRTGDTSLTILGKPATIEHLAGGD